MIKIVNRDNFSGISLIVLIITIIVIIIIAGAIILTLSNSDIIKKANLARESNDFVQIRQMVEMEKTNKLLTDKFDINKIDIPNKYKDDIEVTEDGVIILKYNEDTKITDMTNAIEKLGASYISDGFDYIEGISSKEFDSAKLLEYDYNNIAKVIINGNSEQLVTVKGKNLIEFPYYASSTSKWLVNNDQSINVNVDNGAEQYASFVFKDEATSADTMLPAGTYSFSCGSNNIILVFYYENAQGVNTWKTATNNSSFTLSSDFEYIRMYLQINPNKSVHQTIYPQLELSSAVTGYEPFIPDSPSIKYPSTIESVKNFDLVSVGKNLFDVDYFLSLSGNSSYYEKDNEENLIQKAPDYRQDGTYPIIMSLPEGTYTVALNASQSKYRFLLNGVVTTGEEFTRSTPFTFTFKTWETTGTNLGKIQIEKGTEKTNYESYQGNTINFPYTLRSLPDGTKDYIEIDNINETSKLYRNIGEKIFNGTEAVFKHPSYETEESAVYYSNLFDKKQGNTNIICSHLNNNNGYSISTNKSYISGGQNTYAYFRILKKDGISDAIQFKSWLTQQNSSGTPIKVQYQLATPEVIDLDYEEIRVNYQHINIYTNSIIKPTLGAKVIIK